MWKIRVESDTDGGSGWTDRIYKKTAAASPSLCINVLEQTHTHTRTCTRTRTHTYTILFYHVPHYSTPPAPHQRVLERLLQVPPDLVREDRLLSPPPSSGTRLARLHYRLLHGKQSFPSPLPVIRVAGHRLCEGERRGLQASRRRLLTSTLTLTFTFNIYIYIYRVTGEQG